jgi:hypothetical protein
MRLPPPIAAAALLAAAAALLAASTGCTRRNPDFCCVTADTCAAAGLTDEVRPCEVGQACKAYECVAAECATSADCASPEAPACRDGLCVAGCTADDDCAGIAGRPRCDARDAACVGCTSSDQCPAERSICDADARSCRGCTADGECASGVCIEATGACAANDAIIYVMETGTDTGTCPKSAPCQTLAYAKGLTSLTRNVIRILSGHFYLGNDTAFLYDSIVIDGTDTMLTSGASVASPVLSVGGLATIEGVRVAATDSSRPLISVTPGGSLKLARTRVERGKLEVLVGGKLEASRIRLIDGTFECESGSSVAIERSRFEFSFLDSGCDIKLSTSYLEPPPAPLPMTRFQIGPYTIENSVFVGSNAEVALLLIGDTRANSAFRFNTVVNRSPVVGSAYAVWCGEGLNVASNIFAYNSTMPISCIARNSLFDTAGAQEVSRGSGNRSGDDSIFFKDRQEGDFHLTPGSPAIGFGDPGLISIDIEGNARPMPAGTMPDVGAYEAP